MTVFIDVFISAIMLTCYDIINQMTIMFHCMHPSCFHLILMRDVAFAISNPLSVHFLSSAIS